MVEAMFERSPSYFKQFQKQFKFLVTNEKINLSSVKSFATCSHFDSEFCQLTTTTTKYTNHFHVLIDTSEAATTYDDIFKRNKAFLVSCLFSIFRYLFSSAVDLETKDDVFFKMKLVVDFNIKNEEKPESAATVRKRLPAIVTLSQQLQTKTAGNSNKNRGNIVKSVKTTVVQKSAHNMILSGKQTQTDNFSSETLRRFESVLTGPHSGAFCQIMNIFVSGYGNLNIDTDLLFIRFVYEEKIKI